MTYFLTIIKYYYIFLTILVLVVPLNYGLIKFLPSLIIMWGSYIFFKKGVRARYLKSKENRITNYNQSNDRFLKKIFILFTLFLIVFIPLYIKFYTGNTIQSALLSFAIGTGADSNYSMYQQYFADNNLNTFSVDKLPYIILNGLSKVTFWFFCIYYFAYAKKVDKTIKLCFVIVYLLFFLSGISRGTSFENFELF